MDDIIAAFRAHDLSFNRGASPHEIRALEEALGCSLPSDLVALYRDHDGTRVALPGQFRLMSSEELRRWHDWFIGAPATDRHVGPYSGFRYGIRAFWDDDNSNFAGLYLEGPLAGHVCFLDHEGSYDLSPLYRSIRSFLRSSLAAAEQELDAHDTVTDYPEEKPSADRSASERDWVAAQSLLPLFATLSSQPEHDEAPRQFYGLCILALTPVEHTDALYPFLHDEDMFIQAKACEVFGLRKIEGAVSLLADIAANGNGNGRIAAIHALGMIGTPAALRHVLDLVDVLPIDAWEYHLAGALAGCGCETAHDPERWHDQGRRFERGRWRYRLPGSQEWIPLGSNDTLQTIAW